MPGMGGGYDPNMGGINQGGPGPAPGALTDAQRWLMQNRPGQQWYSPGNYPGGNNSNPGQLGRGPQRDGSGEAIFPNPNHVPGTGTYAFLREDGTPAGSTGFTGSTFSEGPWGAPSRVRGGGSQMGQQGGGGGGQPGGLGQYGGGGGGQQFWLGGGGQMANLMGSMYGNRRF